jgi:hypothetical protein
MGGLFNIALGSFVSKQLNCMAHTHTATSIVENSAQVSSCWLKFVCPWFKVQAAGRFAASVNAVYRITREMSVDERFPDVWTRPRIMEKELRLFGQVERIRDGLEPIL